MQCLASILIRCQELGYTRGLEVIQMSSGEDPKTWEYFDLPVSDYPVVGRGQPYYTNPYGVQRLKPHITKEKHLDPPYADKDVVKQLTQVVQRRSERWD